MPAALAWIGEGHPLVADVSIHELVEAVLAADEAGHIAEEAVRAVSLMVSRSTLDPATMLFQPELWPDASRLRAALDLLASKCPDGTLGSISATAVRNAQHADDSVMMTLCVVAGVTFDELCDRIAALMPRKAMGSWTNQQINAGFAEIDRIIRCEGGPLPAGAEAARPVELVDEIVGGQGMSGWDRMDHLRSEGVPYEVLLAQRIVGGAWEKHRDRTSKRPTRAVALDLQEKLRDQGFDVLLAAGYGGEIKQKDINELVGGGGEIGLVVRTLDKHAPFYAVTFALAKDGGSARKSGATKAKMARPSVPVAVVALGPGWAERRETVSLIRSFGGAIFTELTIDALVDRIAASLPGKVEAP